jgi:molybdopterin converting factor small subunit
VIEINLRVFGPLTDIVKGGTLRLGIAPPYTGEEVFAALAKVCPNVLPWRPSLRLAVNLEYVPFSHVIRQGDEVCLIPPVSGG